MLHEEKHMLACAEAVGVEIRTGAMPQALLRIVQTYHVLPAVCSFEEMVPLEHVTLCNGKGLAVRPLCRVNRCTAVFFRPILTTNPPGIQQIRSLLADGSRLPGPAV